MSENKERRHDVSRRDFLGGTGAALVVVATIPGGGATAAAAKPEHPKTTAVNTVSVLRSTARHSAWKSRTTGRSSSCFAITSA